MKQLLLVDDEKFFLEGLKAGLEKHADIFSTHVCYSVDQAIKLCKKNRYDLIVSDIRMPKKSGLDLFVALKKRKYKGGFIAMTAYGTEEVLRQIRELGGLDIILKPFNLDWFAEKILDYFSEDEGVSGTIDSIDLTSLLQMINLEKKSATVKIEVNGREGFLYFRKGALIHAEFAETKGEEAALALLRLNRGRFSLQKMSQDVDPTVETGLMELLMNIMKDRDEASLQNETKNEARKDDNNAKEAKMNVKKLKEAVEVLKGDMGDGLMATDIFGSDGQSMAGYNTQPKASALFNQITQYMTGALEGSDFPELGRYYILDLVDEKMVVVITMGDFQWGMLVDRTKVQLGLLLNVIMPKAIDAFEEAVAE